MRGSSSYLIPYTNIKSKWTNGLNVRPKTIIFLRRKHMVKLHDIGFGSDFLDMTPKA